MRPLSAITVSCCFAAFWAALALARRRRIRQMLTLQARPVRRTPTREFFLAGEFRTPRPLHLEQEIFQQKPRRPLAEINLAFGNSAPSPLQPVALPVDPMTKEAGISGKVVPVVPAAPASTTLFGQNVSIAQLDSYPKTPASTRKQQAAVANASLVPDSIDVNRRFQPQSVRASGLRRRIDLSNSIAARSSLDDNSIHSLQGSGTYGRALNDHQML